MAKDLVGIRVPKAIAEQVDAYTETYEISKTEALNNLICVGYDREPIDEDRTVWGPEPEHCDAELWQYKRYITGKLELSEPYQGDYESTEAPTARLPDETVERIEDWQKSQDMNRTNAVADLLRRGLRIDPTPEQHDTDAVNSGVKAVLSPELYEKFRKYRLTNRYTKREAVQKLASAVASSKPPRPTRIDWGEP